MVDVDVSAGFGENDTEPLSKRFVTEDGGIIGAFSTMENNMCIRGDIQGVRSDLAAQGDTIQAIEGRRTPLEKSQPQPLNEAKDIELIAH
eukprot:5497619-Pyramimonas_sp.AAC.1